MYGIKLGLGFHKTKDRYVLCLPNEGLYPMLFLEAIALHGNPKQEFVIVNNEDGRFHIPLKLDPYRFELLYNYIRDNA